MDKEIWKDIEGYEGLYQISNLGRVRRLINNQGNPYKTPKISRAQPKGAGYISVTLTKPPLKYKYKTIYREKVKGVHRLVAQAFIPNPRNRPQVNHKNGNKSDNRVENLEWVTCSQNIQHGYDMGLNHTPGGENHPKAKLSNKQAHEIREKAKAGGGFKFYSLIAKEYGVSVGVIYNIVKNSAYKE